MRGSLPVDEVKSISHIALLYSIKNFDSKRGVKFTTYLAKQVRYHVLRERRNNLQQSAIVDRMSVVMGGTEEPIYEVDHGAAEIDEKRRAWLEERIVLLPEHHQEAVRLRLAGQSYKNIAAQTELSTASIRVICTEFVNGLVVPEELRA